MHDNAPTHTAHQVRHWFQENGVVMMDWSPYSPDLNPIEHLWFRLKELVYKINPGIEDVGGDDDKAQDTLFQALEEAWPRLQQELLDELIKSMDTQINAVLEAEGWYTRF